MIHPSHHAKLTPQKIAYQMAETGEALTFGELEEASNRSAHGLRALGVNPGDHIAILMENRLEMMVLVWAAQRSGVVFTLISRYLQQDEAAYIVNDCGAKVFLTTKKYTDVGSKLISLFENDVRCFMVDDAVGQFENWVDHVATMPSHPVDDEQAGAAMLYSSGTTGRPKGIVRKVLNGPIDSLSPVLLKVLGDLGKIFNMILKASSYFLREPARHPN